MGFFGKLFKRKQPLLAAPAEEDLSVYANVGGVVDEVLYKAVIIGGVRHEMDVILVPVGKQVSKGDKIGRNRQ